MSFGENLKKVRKSKGWTQEKLGEEVKPKMSQSAIGQLERSEKSPKKDTIIKLASALQVNPAILEDHNLTIDMGSDSLYEMSDGKFLTVPTGSPEDRMLVLRHVLTEEAWEQWMEIGEAFFEIPSKRKDNGRGLNKEDK